jgi:hypothetical protein
MRHQLSDDRDGDQRSGVEMARPLVDTQQGSDRHRHLAEGFQPCRFGAFEDEARHDVGADLVEVATVFGFLVGDAADLGVHGLGDLSRPLAGESRHAVFLVIKDDLPITPSLVTPE